MIKFNYRAKNEDGKTTSGVVEATNENEAVKLLRARKLLVVSLIPQKASLFSKVKILNRVSMDDKVNFTRQLSTMITAGLPLTESLSILELQSRPAMGQVVAEILPDVEGGGSLAGALKKHSRVFDRVYVALVQAGEAAGILDNVLNRLALNLEKQRDFRNKIKGAMIYPAVIVGGMIVVALIMMIFVIPRLTVLYEEFEAELPVVTKILLGVSKFASSYWWLGVLALVGLSPLIRYLIRYPALKKNYDELYFRIPVLGNIRRQIMFTEFSRTLGLLIGAGILVVDALGIVEGSLGSPIYEEAVAEVTDRVEKGLPLATALAQSGVFPPLLPQMVAVGEETGKLDEVLGKISSYFEQEAETAIKGLTTALEPLILIILGVGVGFLIVAVIMPIYNLTSQF